LKKGKKGYVRGPRIMREEVDGEVGGKREDNRKGKEK